MNHSDGIRSSESDHIQSVFEKEPSVLFHASDTGNERNKEFKMSL